MDGVTRRRAPAAPGGRPEVAGLRLACLPAVEVLRDGRPVTPFRSVAERALLVYLAVEGGRPHDRAGLAGLLWPDAPAEAARHNLSQTVLGLRTALGDRDPGARRPTPAGAPPRWPPARRCAGTPPPGAEVDVGTLLAHLDAVAAHRHPGPAGVAGCPACLGRLAGGGGGLPGPVPGGFAGPASDLFEEWAALKREGLQRRVAGALADAGRGRTWQRGSRRRRRGTPGGSWRWTRWRRGPTGA